MAIRIDIHGELLLRSCLRLPRSIVAEGGSGKRDPGALNPR